MPMLLPKRCETTDSVNNLNNASEILCNMICLAKYFLINRSREGFDSPINYAVMNSTPPHPESGMFSCV